VNCFIAWKRCAFVARASRVGESPSAPSFKRQSSKSSGDRFTVAVVSPKAITLVDGKRQVELPADRPLHLDHAYATTIHSSQGTTADRVFIDASSKSRTTAKDVYYVAISRAQHEARIYTDDVRKLPRAIERDNPKHAALDLERR
jgi:ATP-dependent exoDNAse (exonuclease V) alpha subunit